MATGTITKVMNDSAETNTGGYCKMLDGTLIQWGAVTIAAGRYTVNVPLPVNFINRLKISISVTPVSAEANVFYGANASSVTESQISVGRTPNTAAKTVYWTAIGRWR